MTIAEALLLEAAEDLAIAVDAGFDTDRCLWLLHCVCRDHYPDSVLAKDLPIDRHRVLKVYTCLTDPLAYEILYT